MATVKDIAKALASRHKIKGAEAEKFLQQMVEVINAGLLSDRVVKIKGFGTFKLQAVKDRASVNVNTGERVVIEGHDKVTFTPDSVMKEIINKPFAQFETVVIDDDSPLLKEGFAAMEDEEEGYDDVISTDEEEIVSVADDKPAATGEQPVVTEEQPIVTEEQPIVTEEQPVVTEEQPVVTKEQPVVTEEQPVVTEEQPAPTEEQPSNPIAPLIDKSIGAPVLKTENLTVLAENVTVVKEKLEEKDSIESTPPVTEQRQDNIESEKVKPEDIEQSNNIKTEKEDEIDETTETEEMEDNKFKYSSLLINIVIAIIFFALGYWVGNTNLLSDIKVPQGKVHEDSVTVTQLPQVKDSTETPDNQSETKAAEPASNAQTSETKPQASVQDNAASAASSKPAQQQKQEETPLTQYNSDPRVKTGAYYIIGTETEVTAKEGQTLRSIAKSYLGPGMECYVEAYNGIKEVKPGQKVKIPKLKMKKIRK